MMIKRKGSITRIVKVKSDTTLTVGSMNAERYMMTGSVVGLENIPHSDYRVTYYISPRGKFECYESSHSDLLRIQNIKTKNSRVVCWLSKYFNGNNLSRKVEIIKKRKK